MPKITIDNIDYHTEDLNEHGNAQLASLQFVETQMQSLRNEIAVYQTARNAYMASLKAHIEQAGIEPRPVYENLAGEKSE